DQGRMVCPTATDCMGTTQSRPLPAVALHHSIRRTPNIGLSIRGRLYVVMPFNGLDNCRHLVTSFPHGSFLFITWEGKMHEANVLVSEVIERPSESVASPKLGDCVIVPLCTES